MRTSASPSAAYRRKRTAKQSNYVGFVYLGATPRTEFTILSDGAEGPRGLGEAASIGPTLHVLDWFHLSMRIQHVAQTVSGWPTALAQGDQEGARIADAVERIKWRLWHSQVQRALDLVAEDLAVLAAAGRNLLSPSPRQLGGLHERCVP